MEITTEMTISAYKMAKDVYDGKIEQSKALDSLDYDCGMNRGSANDYIHGFKKNDAGRKIHTYI